MCAFHAIAVVALALFAEFYGTAADYTCYSCSWSSPGVTSEAEAAAAADAARIAGDICRPDNFDPGRVSSESCAHGCKTSYMYVKGPHINLNATKDGKGIMTFVSRLCSSRQIKKPSCESSEIVGIVQEECFCDSNYCNSAPLMLGTRHFSATFACLYLLTIWGNRIRKIRV